MKSYIVTEVVKYRVQAENVEHAERIIEEAADRDKYVIAVTERDAFAEDGNDVYEDEYEDENSLSTT